MTHHHAIAQFEKAVQRGDVTAIRALWPSVRKCVIIQPDYTTQAKSVNQE